jgi:hypothetical protein
MTKSPTIVTERKSRSPLSQWQPTTWWTNTPMLVGAALVAWSAAIHLHLWQVGYRNIPTIGPLFLLQAIGGFVVAAVVAGVRRLIPALMGIGLLASTLGGLVLSAEVGLFGFRDSFDAPFAHVSLLVEIAGIVVLSAACALRVARGRRTSAERRARRTAGGSSLKQWLFVAVPAAVVGLAAVAYAPMSSGEPSSSQDPTSFLHQLRTITQITATVPSNGDVNPYGVAVVPATVGQLVAGDTLVSNFNDKANVQGTGTTIVEISPAGSARLFADISPDGRACPGGIGLTTALGILPGGWVVVGSLPTSSGGTLPGLDPAGCLIVLNDHGTAVETIVNKDLVGPWDLTLTSSATSATIFVANALGGNTSTEDGAPFAGNCTVVRLDLDLSTTAPPRLRSSTVIGTGYPWQANQAALVLAPTGLALGRNGTLYVDDTETNSISAIPGALSRTSALAASATILSSGGALDGPLGMVVAPNQDIVVVNGNNGNAVEVSPTGKQVAVRTLVPNGAGDLFGLTTTTSGDGILFVNDGANALDVFRA